MGWLLMFISVSAMVDETIMHNDVDSIVLYDYVDG